MATTKEKAEIELVINNKVAKSSLKELRLELIEESRILDKMKKEDDPAGWLAQAKKVGIMRQSVAQANIEINAAAGSFKKLSVGWKDIAAGFLGGNILSNGLDKLMAGLQGTVVRNGELSDSFANVAKDTGMTTKEVTELNKELQQVNTRTAVDELRELASMGGKFGVAENEIEDFVTSTDKLNVAFGDQFDSVEELADTTLKLRNIFQDIKSDNIGDDILHIGNAMNVLESEGAATGKGMSDLSNRIGGVAIPLGLTTAQVLGLSAVLEELNVAPERGATAVTTILQKMLTDTTAFAKVAKMEVKDFEHLLNTDLMAAFMAVTKGAQQGGSSATAFAKILKDTELSGSGASEVLLKLASNQDMLASKVLLATNALKSTTSVTNEFNVKNENSQAILDKLGKKWTAWVDRLAAGLNPMIQLFGRWAGVVDDTAAKLGEFAAQQEKVISAETQLPKLIDRYEELRVKTDLTAIEQAELSKVVSQISEMVPGAVTEFDKYGNAMWINTGITRSFIKEQRELLETMRNNRKEELVSEKETISRNLKNLQRQLNSGTIKQTSSFTGETFDRKMTDDEIKATQKNIAKLQQQKMELVQSERELNGIAQRSAGRGQRAPKEDPDKPNVPGAGISLSKEEEKKAISDRQRLNDELLKNQQELTLAIMKDHDRELQAAQNKYDGLATKAKGNAAALAQIEQQRVQEIDQINTKYTKKYLTDFDKTIRGQLDVLNDQKKEENKYAQERSEDVAKRADKELFEITDHYDKEIALAKSRNESVVQLERDKQVEIDKLTATRATKATTDLLTDIRDGYQSDLALAEETGFSKEAIVREHLERLKLLREQYGLLDIEQQKNVNKEIAKGEKDLLAIKLDNINKTGAAMTAGSQAISDLLSLTASNQSEYAEFQKALGLFQIAVETGTAIASAVATGTKGDPYTVALRIATAVAAVAAGMLKAKALMNEAKQPATPAFREHGGYTDLGSITHDNSGNPEGWVRRPTLFNLGNRSYVAGEGYKKEYVLSNAMLRNPAIADFASGVEALRQQRFFEHGGSTAMSSGSAQVAFDPRMNDMLKYLQIIASKPGGFNYSAFEQYRDNIEDTRARASA